MVLASICLSGCATSPNPPADLLETYSASSLAGIHSHPIGWEGKRLDRAEQALDHRRTVVARWLAGRYGRDAIDRIDADRAEAAMQVYFVSGPTEEQEWAAIRSASRELRRLEQQMTVSGPH